MLGGAYSSQFRDMERQQVDTIKTFDDNEKADAIARSRKLSLETNRRRRALVVKRKIEQQKEEKRRQQILSKRRDKQREATERFQRAHMPARLASGSSASSRWSPKHGSSLLEDALRVVRGSPSSSRSNSARSSEMSSPTHAYYRQDSDTASKPYFNKYAHPNINSQPPNYNGQERHDSMRNKSLHNLNNSRTLFEQQLQTHQQTLIAQQQNSLREFNKQLMREVEVERPVQAGGMMYGDLNDVTLERSDSLSSADSLEETASTSTLRESCDLESFNGQQYGSMVNGAASDTKVCRALTGTNGNAEQGVKVNSFTGSRVVTTDTVTRQNIDTPAQAHIQERIQEEKDKYYHQRQQEIQQQLEQQHQKQMFVQQKQQQELQQHMLEQQQKQQYLLQQQLQKQQKEQMERQQQQQEQVQLQQQQHEKFMQLAEITPASATDSSVQAESTEKEKCRPKVKAWATPSPHPTTQASAVISPSQNLVTHSAPHTSKNTLTNVTTVMLYDKIPPSDGGVKFSTPHAGISSPHTGITTPTTGISSKSAVSTLQQNQTKTNSNLTAPTAPPMDTYSKTSVHSSDKQQAAVNALSKVTFSNNVQNGDRNGGSNNKQDKQEDNLSFLAAVTNDLTKGQDTRTNDTIINSQPPTEKGVQFQQNKSTFGNSTSTQTSKSTVSSQNKPSVVNTPSKPSLNPSYYISSYSNAYTANKQAVNSGNNSKTFDTSGLNGSIAKGTLGIVDGQLSMVHHNKALDIQDDAMDTGDTDSVSTICEEREPELKVEVRSILKKPASSKKGGILKKGSSTGNIRQGEIRDSLEITRVHLRTSADEKEQQPSKKNVRWGDLTYNEPEDKTDSDTEQDKFFIKRNQGPVAQKPPRPISAMTSKAAGNSDKLTNKITRASSASTVRASSIPRAKTQIVRPQAAAHIITQSSQTGNGNQDGYFNTNEKRVTIVNNNFMEKVPSMVRQHDLQISTATTTPVHAVTVIPCSRPVEQKTNYAVSSIMLPKSESGAPFIYPTYVAKSAMAPTNSSNVPNQAMVNDGAVYDENGLRIDRTPTDDEINNLWDNVRTCLNRNSQATPDTANQGNDVQTLPRQAASVSQKYIDGASLGQFNSLNRVAQQPASNPLRRQNSADSVGGYTKRYGLLQQRRQQTNPQSLKSRQLQQQQQQGYTVYNAPVQSHEEPQPAAGQPVDQVSESMAGFLAAEQLSEQSVSDSRIHQAIDEAQLRQMAYNNTRPQPKVKSALSVEEQRLLESLDRLNDKLKITEAAIPNKTNSVQQHLPLQQQQEQQQQQVLHVDEENRHTVDNVGGFRGHTPIHSSQRRAIETANQKARLRLTSATLKRNNYRQQ